MSQNEEQFDKDLQMALHLSRLSAAQENDRRKRYTLCFVYIYMSLTLYLIVICYVACF